MKKMLQNLKVLFFILTIQLILLGATVSTVNAQAITVLENSGSAPNDGIICAGATVILTATGGTSFFWSTGEITPSITVTPPVNTSYTCVIDVTLVTQDITVNQILPVSVTIAESENNVCAGTSVTFTATPTNGGVTPSYQWQVNGSAVGSDQDSYTYAPVNGDIVTVILTSSESCNTGSPATSNSITMTVIPTTAVSVSISESANNICEGTSVTFTATPTNGGTTPAYQWKVNGSNVGSNTDTYTYTPANGDVVTLELTSNAVCPSPVPAISNSITMVVNPILPVSVTISESDNDVCAGTSVTFTATPTNGGTTPSYQWQVNGSVVGSDQDSYSYAPANGDVVTVILTSSESCITGSPATSNSITMTVNLPVPVSVSIIESENNVCDGTSVTFTATPTNGGVTPSYQWQVNGSAVGADQDSYTYTPVNGDIVTVILTSSESCNTGSPATSNSITMTVIPTSAVSVSISESANNICEGTSVTFTATPTNGGTTPAYQWKVNGSNVGSNTDTYTYTPANGDVVTLELTSNAVCPSPVPAISNSITMVVNPILPVSVTISESDNDVCAGTSVTFTATPTNGGTTPSYQWQVNGSVVGSDQDSYSYTPANGDVVTVILTSSESCITGSPATSNAITMDVDPILPVSVSITESDNNICDGTSVTFTATPTNGGTTPSYQWQVNGSPVGTDLNTYTYVPTNGDIISCILTSSEVCTSGNPATSNTVTMIVNPLLPVSVLIAEDLNNVCDGTSVTFTATPTNGGTTPAYQWKVNGSNVGSNTDTYTYTPANGDVVTLELTSNAVCPSPVPAISNSITMVVNPLMPVSVSITESGNNICDGTSVTFTAAGINGGPVASYQWQVNGSAVGSDQDTYTYAPADGDEVTVIFTSGETCATGSPATSNVITMIVNDLPVPTISGPDTVCRYDTVVYFTETGMSGYTWAVVGGTIIAGTGTDVATVRWNNAAGNRTVSVTYTDANGCEPLAPTIFNVRVNGLPSPNITGPNDVCLFSTGNIYTTQNNRFDYQWNVVGGTITSGAGTREITVTWETAGLQSVSVNFANVNGCYALNPTVYNVQVNPLPVPVIAVSETSGETNDDGIICAGDAVTLTASGGTSFLWSPGGETTAGITVSPAVTTTYSVTVTDANGCSADTSQIITVNPVLPVSISIIESANNVCFGTAVTMTATPTNGGATPDYQWQVNGSDVGTNLITYSFVPANGDVITCILTSSEACASGNPATSNAITMIVEPILPVSVTINASDNNICDGESILFTATPANGGTTPSYQWQVNGSDVGADQDTYTYAPANGDEIICILTSSEACTSGNPATSNTVTMIVNPSLPVAVTISVSENPICAGTTVLFTAVPENGGSEPSYQWKINGSDIGLDQSTFSIAPADGDIVTVELTSSDVCATGSPATSNAITMDVDPILPVSVSITESDNNICDGTSVTFTATPTNGGTTPSYEWQVNGSTVGADQDTYDYVPANGDAVNVILTSSEACKSGSPATSDIVNMVVNPLPTPVITVAETSGIANNDGITCSGATVVLTASGGTSYLWATGEITASITVNPTSTTTYSVTVTDGLGCSASTDQIITVNPLPVAAIAIDEASGIEDDGFICEPGVTVSLTASGGIFYLWSIGQITPTITVNPMASTLYQVAIRDVNGCIATASQIITLTDPIVATIAVAETSGTTADDAITCAGDTATLTASGGSTYLWSTGEITAAITVNPLITTVYTVEVFDAFGCSEIATQTITVNPVAVPTILGPDVVCNNSTGNVYTTEAEMTGYSWAITGGTITSGTGTNSITVTWTASGTQNVSVNYSDVNGCAAAVPTDYPVTVNPIPTVDAVSDQVLCNGANTTAVTFSGAVAGTVFDWTNDAPSIGLAASGSGDIASFVATNATNAPIVATVTVTPEYTNAGVTCTGTPITFTITVNPTPTVDAVANQVLCNGANTTAVTFSGAVTGTVFNWTNDAPSIGLAASGSGDIASFVATNTTNAPVVATVTVTLEYTNAGVTCTGTPITFTITVNPTPTVDAVANQVLCNGANTTAVTFSGAVAGTVFDWTNDTPSIGLAASGSGNIASFVAINTGIVPVVATVTVTPSYTNAGVTCTGTPITFTITVNPTPTVDAVANQVLCNGANTTAVTFSGAVTGTVFNWTNDAPSIGLAASGTGNIASFVATNATNAPIVATVTVTPEYTNAGVTCTGTPITFTITVNPTPTVDAVANQVLCNGANTTAVTFSGAVAGTVFDWTNDTPSIGLAASGSGNIASFVAINTGIVPVVATVTVTPSYTNAGVTCTGTPITFTITVNPTPTVDAVANQVLCNGANTTAVTFSGAVTGTVFNWTNDAPSIGLAASGTGNIASFVATNTTNAPVVATVTVTPEYTNAGVTCTGTPITFTITVNPTPTVDAVANQVLCNGANTTAVTFSGAVTGTVFNWTNDAPSIGLAASGSGDIASFVATNTTNAPVVATVTVTPEYTNAGVTCTGTPISFTITVNPTPIVNAVANQVLCNGANTTAVTFSSPTTGGTLVYNWINNTTSIGLAASGTGNIASFVATNITNAPVVATVTVTPEYTNAGVTCTGTPISFTITVNPTPTVDAVANQVLCNASSTTAVTFSGAVSGTVFNWTNDAPSIGLAASGTGNIASFVATNTTNAPVVATVTVTPEYTNAGVTCTGTPISFTITVNPTPIPTITGPDAVCAGTEDVIYTTEAGNTHYTWSVSNGGIITGGHTTNTVTVDWNAAGNKFIAVSYTNSYGCEALTPTMKWVTVHSLPAPMVFGEDTVCMGTQNVQYTTQANYSNYEWVVSAGGTIVSGAGTKTILVNWNGSGNQTVSVNYTNQWGCEAAEPFVLDVYVTPKPAAAGVISGPTQICLPESGVVYTVAVIADADSYVWTVPAGVTIVSGAGTNSITVDFAATAATGVFKVLGSNECGNGASSPNLTVTVGTTPATPTITYHGDTLTSSAPAGNQWYKDGVLIPGATGMDYVTTEIGTYTVIVTINGCSSEESAPFVITSITDNMNELNTLLIQPNPNTGKFKLTAEVAKRQVCTLEIITNTGVTIFREEGLVVDGKFSKEVDIVGTPAGIYMVVLRNSEHQVIRKMIVTH